MKTSVKHIVFILLVILSASAVCPALLQLKQIVNRQRMLHRMEKESLQTLHLKKGELVWFKKNKELLVDGKLFDVKSIRFENEMAIVKGLYDHKEDELVYNIRNHQTEKKEAAGLKLSHLPLFPIRSHSFRFPFVKGSKPTPMLTFPHILTNPLPVQTPPPDAVFS